MLEVLNLQSLVISILLGIANTIIGLLNNKDFIFRYKNFKDREKVSFVSSPVLLDE